MIEYTEKGGVVRGAKPFVYGAIQAGSPASSQQADPCDRHSHDRRIAAALFLELEMGARPVCHRLDFSICRPLCGGQPTVLFKKSRVSSGWSLVDPETVLGISHRKANAIMVSFIRASVGS